MAKKVEEQTWRSDSRKEETRTDIYVKHLLNMTNAVSGRFCSSLVFDLVSGTHP